MHEPIRIISATRESREGFQSTHLATSLAALAGPAADVELDIAYENVEGLPVIYNRAIERARASPAVLVFVHDDVYIADSLWIEELRLALEACDVVGLAGNKRRQPKQAAWCGHVANGTIQWDLGNMSGFVGHGKPPGDFMMYGPPRVPCVLLDGLFLAARSTTLHAKGLAFDPRFTFDFYDLDFCRAAERLGMTVGTAFIKVVHDSHSPYATPKWRAARHLYFEKWRD